MKNTQINNALFLIAERNEPDLNEINIKCQDLGFSSKVLITPSDFTHNQDKHCNSVLLVSEGWNNKSCVQIAGQFRSAGYNWPIIAASQNGTFEQAAELVKLEVSEFITKPLDPQKLEAALRNANTRAYQIKQEQRLRSERDDHLRKLSPRQRDIFDCVTRGLTNKEIAAKFNIHRRTVETHRRDMMLKLECHLVSDLHAIKEGKSPFTTT